MRKIRAAGALVFVGALLTTPAHASAAKSWAPCAMTDPPGDVRLDSDGPTIAADHVDLRSFSIAVAKKSLVVVFKNTVRDPNRLGEWSATFTAGRYPLYVLDSEGAWISAGTDPGGIPGVHAGVVGGQPGTGSRTLGPDGTITVTIPLSVFGAAAPKKGTVIANVGVRAMEKFLTTGTTMVGPMDTGAWPYRLTVGGGCRLK
jgi:hypothetical protein